MIDGLAAAAWIAALLGLIAQTWLVSSPMQAQHVWRWAVVLALLGLALTNVATTTWRERNREIRENLAQIRSLTERAQKR